MILSLALGFKHTHEEGIQDRGCFACIMDRYAEENAAMKKELRQLKMDLSRLQGEHAVVVAARDNLLADVARLEWENAAAFKKLDEVDKCAVESESKLVQIADAIAKYRRSGRYEELKKVYNLVAKEKANV